MAGLHHIVDNFFGYGGEFFIELRRKTLIEGYLVAYFDTVDRGKTRHFKTALHAEFHKLKDIQAVRGKEMQRAASVIFADLLEFSHPSFFRGHGIR